MSAPRPGLGETVRTFWAWLRALPRPVLLVAGATGVALAALLALGAYDVYDYTMNNPAFCRSCHIMESAWTRWTTSAHRTVDCHACHQQRITESARQVIVFAFRRPERVGRHADVPAVRCQACHTSGDPRWAQVARTAGHVVHAERQQIQCVVCHSTGIHRIVRPTQVCVNCHQAQAAGARVVQIPAMAEFHCVNCHEFLRPDSPLRPTRLTCLGCHRALPPKRTVGWPPGAPHSGFACGQCHKPHEKAQPVVACATCHTAPRPALHQRPAHAAATCATCHVPHAFRVQSRQTCLSCHQDKAAHNAPTACSVCHVFR